MDEVVIYTFGHLSIFKSIFQALAVLFDPTQTEFFVSSDGMGLGIGATLAAMVAFLGAGFNWFDTEKFTPHTALYGMILYSLLFVPKMPEVWLSDLYTGRTEVVNNVPFGVAILGNAFSSLAVGISRNFEVQYTSPGSVDGLTYSNNVLSTGAGGGSGFLSPLKSMLFFRHNTFMYLPKHIKSNLVSYQEYCIKATANGDLKPIPAFSYTQMAKEVDPFAYLFDENFIDATLAAYAKKIDGSEEFLTCLELNAALSGAGVDSLEYQIGNAESMGVYAYRATATGQNYEEYLAQTQNGGTYDASGSLTELNEQLSSILSNGVNAQKFMRAALSRDLIRLGKEFSGLSPEMQNDYAVTMTTAVENSKILQAVEGEEFLKWSMAAMSALQFLFYALTPIVGLALVAKGAGAFKYFGGYLLFGLWSYSWIPVASAINFWSIGSFMETFNAQDGVMGITPELVEVLISQGEEAIAVGANLLAMTPLVTFAILSSGGAYAMTSLAKAANPNGGASQAAANLAPALRDNPSLVKMKDNFQQSVAGETVGASSYVSSELGNHSFGTQASKNSQIAAAERYTDSYEQKATAAKENAANNLSSVLKSVGSGKSFAAVEASGVTIGTGLSAGLRELGVDSSALSTTQRDAIMGQLSTGASIGDTLKGAVQASHGNEAARSLTAQQIEAAETAFLSNTQVSDSYTSSNGVKSDNETRASVNEGASKVAKTSASLTDAKQIQQSALKEISESSEFNSGYKKDGLNVLADAINKPSTGVDNSFDSGANYLSQQYRQAAIDYGYSDQDADAMASQFKADLTSAFESSNKFHPDRDSSSAAAFSTFFDKVKAGGKDVKENALLQDAQRNLLNNTGNSTLTPEKEKYAPLEKVESNIAKHGGALKKTAQNGTKGAPVVSDNGSIDGNTAAGTISATDSKLSSGSPFKESELSPLQDAFSNFNSASDKITGNSGDKGANYQANFDKHANDIAARDHDGKTFDQLGRNDARKVAFEAGQATASDFRNDFKESMNNTPGGNDRHNQEVLAATDNLINSAQGLGDFAKNTSSPIKNKGSLAEGQFGNYAQSLKNASNGINKFSGGVEQNKDINNDQLQKQADKTRESYQGKSVVAELIQGKEGVPLPVLEESKGFLDDHYQALRNGEDANAVNARTDQNIDDSVEKYSQIRTQNAKSFISDNLPESYQNKMDFNLSNTGEPIKNDMNANQKSGYSAPQSLALTTMEWGASTSGNVEGIALANMEAGAVAGTIETIASAFGGKKLQAAKKVTDGGGKSDPLKSAFDNLQGAATTAFVIDSANQQNKISNHRDAMSLSQAVDIASNDIVQTTQRMFDNGNQNEAVTMLKEMSRGMGHTSPGALFTVEQDRASGEKSLSINENQFKNYINNGGFDGQDKDKTNIERTKILFDTVNDMNNSVIGANQQNYKSEDVDSNKRSQSYEDNEFFKRK